MLCRRWMCSYSGWQAQPAALVFATRLWAGFAAGWNSRFLSICRMRSVVVAYLFGLERRARRSGSAQLGIRGPQ
jgi:hypothetical protein